MIDWSAIKTVFLDMDGTLLDLHFDNHFWLVHLPLRYSQHHQLDPEQATRTVHQRIREERGSLNWYCVDYWTEELGVDIAALKAEIKDRIGYRPHVETFLQRLRDRGYRVVIVTNAHHKAVALKMAVTGLDRKVDRVISTHSYGLPKEDPAFWRKLQQDEPFDPATTLLIDDSGPVLDSARQFGIAHLLAVLAPDLQQPPRDVPGHQGFHHFDEVMP
ncbi:GMP/IMP nucleotidase [Marinobacteraceae bacterium S3BR75-40.1]